MPPILPYAAVVPDTRSILPRDVFTYTVPDDLDALAIPGARVEVPFGARTVTGYVVERTTGSDFEAPRALMRVLDEAPLLDENQVRIALWIAARYVAPLGEVIKAMLPSGVRSAKPGGRKRGPRTTSRGVAAIDEAAHTEAPPLTGAQQAAAAPLLQAVDAHTHIRLLLHGVTGSGKTEVYLAAISRALEHGRGVIVLVPEISLTPQTVARFAGRFPGRVALVHSGLTDAERAAQWRRIREGEADVVVGSRSAVFAPLRAPGVIVVDEEDAGAYKQDRVPRYNAVDVALELGRLHGIPVVLGSATPRVETFFHAKTGAMEYAELPERIAGRALPPIEVVDLREELQAGNRSPLSQTLERALRETHANPEAQSILFLNRRGSATVVVCRTCGAVLTCPNCSVSMVYHQGRARCDCHYCGAVAAVPMTCPECHSPSIRGLGMGTEKLEHEVRQLFPKLRLLRMDRDTVSHRDAYYDIYEKFRNHEADCLIGTQMVAKGWDLAGVRLVGIVNADTALHFPDYRSGEITFSLLTQVAGRAGRGDEPARVVLQTYSPGHYAIRHALGHDYLNFARDEIRIRRALHFPPYARLVQCTFAHTDDGKAEQETRLAVQKVSGILASGDGLDVLGPAPAFLHRLRGEYRWQFTVRGEAIERTFPHLPRGRGWSIDVDPAP
jgi:primosomal protein N' (replication factor Y)